MRAPKFWTRWPGRAILGGAAQREHLRGAIGFRSQHRDPVQFSQEANALANGELCPLCNASLLVFAMRVVACGRAASFHRVTEWISAACRLR
jgi:hypothetical protein